MGRKPDYGIAVKNGHQIFLNSREKKRKIHVTTKYLFILKGGDLGNILNAAFSWAESIGHFNGGKI